MNNVRPSRGKMQSKVGYLDHVYIINCFLSFIYLISISLPATHIQGSYKVCRLWWEI